MSSGEIIVYNDNKFLLQGANNKTKQDSQCALEVGIVVAKLKKLKDKATMNINF